MRVIILAAGQGYQLDGFNKLLIHDPVSNMKLIDKFSNAFSGMEITIVVGYRAINVMHKYPDYHYVYNPEWAASNNSYSLSLAINEEPCYVISGDLLIEPDLVEMLENAGPNLVVTQMRDNRTPSALNVLTDKQQNIQELYQGKLHNLTDPEAIGIYKISSPGLLLKWKRNCRKYSNLFIGQNLPFNESEPVRTLDVDEKRLDEINTPMDYLRLLEKAKK
jgi:choline kinase